MSSSSTPPPPTLGLQLGKLPVKNEPKRSTCEDCEFWRRDMATALDANGQPAKNPTPDMPLVAPCYRFPPAFAVISSPLADAMGVAIRHKDGTPILGQQSIPRRPVLHQDDSACGEFQPRNP